MNSVTLTKQTESLYLHLKKLGFKLHEISLLSSVAHTLQKLAERACNEGTSPEIDAECGQYLLVVKAILDDHFLPSYPDYKLTFNPDPRGCPIQVFNLPSSFQNGWENDLVIFSMIDEEN